MVNVCDPVQVTCDLRRDERRAARGVATVAVWSALRALPLSRSLPLPPPLPRSAPRAVSTPAILQHTKHRTLLHQLEFTFVRVNLEQQSQNPGHSEPRKELNV
ncbi:unnamed protein product [Leptosia nina]|uniref:Uncharacterized protein n=1 Tax=Leptosia nina TaxID=320188 RepID=A0AAV1JVX2_9NEOP